MRKRKYTNDMFIEAVKNSKSFAEVIKRLGIKPSGSVHERMKSEVLSLNISIEHFTGQSWSKNKTVLDDSRLSKIPTDQIFVENSVANKSYIRKLILIKNIIEYKCICGNIGQWNSKPLTLQLDHINGNPRDQRITNLRWLCPNCHTQTETFCSKNQKFTSKKKISDREIIDGLIKSEGNIHQTLIDLKIENGRNYNRVYNILHKMLLNFPKTKLEILNGCQSKLEDGSYSKKICENCNKDLPIFPNSKRKFCSTKCSNSSIRIRPKKINWPSKIELLELIKQSNYRQLGIKLGVSDNAIRKRINNPNYN